MKKAAIILIIALIGFFLIRNLLKKNPVFLPAFTPPKIDIRKSLTNPSALKFPLNVPQGYSIGIYADLGNDMPRVLVFDPNGVLFASLTGSGKVVALPNNNGRADKIVTVLSGLNRPHGLAFDSGKLYVAETDKVVRYNYDPSTFSASSPEVLFNLPGNGEHFTRTIRIFGGKLYITIGSTCNACDESQQYRASMLISDLDGKNLRIFAKGLRNTVFFTFDRQGRIWGNDMGRDYLGDNLPPDELNILQDSKDYGWPYCYGNKVRDSNYKSGQVPNYCDATEPAIYGYPAHTANLGLIFDNGNILVAQHGSWNSSVPVGYKVIKLTLSGESVVKSEDYITGWIDGSNVLGRPVDLIFDKSGNLFISDDKAGLVYILFKP